MTPQSFLSFWFSAGSQERWFDSTPEFDRQLADDYESLWLTAADGGLADWESTAEGALALVIVLDQLPLNMFRGRPESFSTEAASRAVADRAIRRGFDRQLDDERRLFLFMPWMHSEDLADQDRSVGLFEDAGFDPKWARHHREIVRRFGRFPHRNAILGRQSTPAEIEWLASDEGFGG